MKDIAIMDQIQTQKEKDIEAGTQQELNAEGTRMAEEKRESFDIPINAVKVDPLR